MQRKKIKILRKLKPTDQIIKRDDQTFYVPSSDPEKEPYMVFNSLSKGWMCDCLDFTIHLNIHRYECKHIKRAITYQSNNS